MQQLSALSKSIIISGWKGQLAKVSFT